MRCANRKDRVADVECRVGKRRADGNAAAKNVIDGTKARPQSGTDGCGAPSKW
jgi:hypothetical protein